MALFDRPDSFFNSSLAFVPSSEDLMMALPRLAKHITSAIGLSDSDIFNVSNSTLGLVFDQGPSPQNYTAPPADPWTEYPNTRYMFSSVMHAFQRLGNFDGVFGYLGSRWALSALVMVSIVTTLSSSTPTVTESSVSVH